ncbi:hypothetical protein EBU95_09970, partial [bacterium]|nr:hypothetical protein [bacterium]
MKKLSFLIVLCFFQATAQAEIVEKLPYMLAHEDYALEAPIQITAIALRFYYVKRLRNSLNFFAQYSQKYFLKENLFYTERQGCIFVDDITFEHPLIIKIIKELCATKKIDALLHVWNDLKNYRYIHDELLIKEFSILVAYILHEGTLHCFYSDQNNKEQIKKMYVFKSLHTMPIEEVLD